jgi:hypothetical protein
LGGRRIRIGVKYFMEGMSKQFVSSSVKDGDVLVIRCVYIIEWKKKVEMNR